MTKPTIIDVWMQFPNRRFLLDQMFDSLRRWPSHWRTLADSSLDISADKALAEMKTQNVSKVIASAWWSPQGPMITNEEVAAIVRRNPDDVIGIASVSAMRRKICFSPAMPHGSSSSDRIAFAADLVHGDRR